MDAITAAFLPAAQEIEATPPGAGGRAVLWTLIALCVAALAWASLSRVDIVAIAPGRLVPAGQVKLLQSLEAGTVKAIHVVEGQRVRAGQALIELDPTLARADRARVAAELDAARQELARQRAFVVAIGRSRPPAVATGLVAAQRAALAAATAGHSSRLRQLDQSIARRRAELQATRAQVGKLERTLPLVSERAAALLRLAGAGLVPRQSALEPEQQRIEVEQDLAAARATAAATEAAIGELVEERRGARAQAEGAAFERIAELEARVAALSQEDIKRDRRARAGTLRAPVDGEVQQLAVHTVGGVVQPGATLAVVVPSAPALELEALVLDRDIGFVREGQRAVVKLDAFPFTRYGAIEGAVTTVGEDSVPHERLGPVYPVRVRVARNDIRVDGREVRLSSGMAASVEIRTGERRVIDYLLSPVARAAEESLRER
jgi:hemolysin D